MFVKPEVISEIEKIYAKTKYSPPHYLSMPESKGDSKKHPTQVVGNVGLYYVCYELSKRGWNAMPTARNAKGVDVVVYNQDATESHTIQVKALSKRSPVPLGGSLDHLIADFYVICRKVFEDEPETFIMTGQEIKDNVHVATTKRDGTLYRDGKVSIWLQPNSYEMYKDRWELVGDGY